LSEADAASPQRHVVTSSMQQNHDTAKLLIDLLVRVVRVEAKVEDEVEKRTDMEGLKQQDHDTSTLVQNLLERMVKVEAKAKEVDEKRTDMEARVKILELEVKKLTEELGSKHDAGLGKEAKMQDLIGKMAEMKGETESGKKEMVEKLEKRRS
jgi:hypothetical protein